MRPSGAADSLGHTALREEKGEWPRKLQLSLREPSAKQRDLYSSSQSAHVRLIAHRS
jgi:hypothetical protein